MNATKFFILLAVVAVLGTGAWLGLVLYDRISTELAILHFTASPSQTGAQTLTELVDGGAATPKQVQRILPLLLTPQVTKEPVYPLGPAPKVRVERPYEVVLENLVVDVNEFVWFGGESQYGTGMAGARTLGKNPHALSLYPVPTEPGVYTMEIRYTYKLRPRRRYVWHRSRDALLPRRRWVEIPDASAQPPRYECRISVPLELAVGEPGQSAADVSP
jgi:hypothetical protein